jgi:hypothetical protein
MMGVSRHKRDEKGKMGSPILIISLSMISIHNAEMHASLSKSNYYNNRVKKY